MGSWKERIGAGDGDRFTDGNMADVRRVGDLVVRSRSPWSNTSHAVLRHLASKDHPGAPRLVDVNDTHEVLSYLPGDSLPPNLGEFRSHDTLVMIAEAIRSLHIALSDFVPPLELPFPEMPHAPENGSFACHNGLAPWNTIVKDRMFVGFIDWDLVTLATPAWDLAYAAWRFVPLYPDDSSFGRVEARGRRLKLFLDTYGLTDAERSGFIDLIRQRQLSGYLTVEQWGRARLPGFDRLFDQGLHLGALDDIVWLDMHRTELQQAIGC